MRRRHRILKVIVILLIIIGIIWVCIEMAKAWVGDSSDPHVLMGNQLIQHSLFNRLMK